MGDVHGDPVSMARRILPGAAKLRRRSMPPTGIVIHTTGRGLSGKACQIAGPDADASDIDDAAIAHYENGSLPFFGHWLIGWGGAIYQLADDSLRAHHSGALGLHYDDRGWMDIAKPLVAKGASTPRRHGRPGHVVYDWWLSRWGEIYSSPLQMVSGREPNATTIGVDLLPRLDGTYVPEQVAALRWLIRKLCEDHGIPRDRRHILGHEDVDPCARGTILRKDRIIGIPWDPGPLDWSALALPTTLESPR